MVSFLLKESQAPTGDLCPSGLAPPFHKTQTFSFGLSVKFPLCFSLLKNDRFGTFFKRGARWLELNNTSVFPFCQEKKSRIFQFLT